MAARHPLSYEFYERHSPQLEIFGGPNFFPEELCQELVVISDASEQRKLEFNFSYPVVEADGLPDALRAAAEWADRYRAPVNTAILKRYDIHEPYQSAAYKPHRDPKIYQSQRIVLVSLSGEADITVTTSDGETSAFGCLPGTVLFIAPHILHSVTEPLNPGGIRHFLFMGYKL